MLKLPRSVLHGLLLWSRLLAFFWNLTRIRLCLTHLAHHYDKRRWETKTKTKIVFEMYGATIINNNIFGVHTEYVASVLPFIFAAATTLRSNSKLLFWAGTDGIIMNGLWSLNA